MSRSIVVPATLLILLAIVATPKAAAQTPPFITAWGGSGTGDGQFTHPYGIAIDASDNVFVTDGENNRIQKFDSNGNFLLKWGTFGSGNGQMNSPFGLTVDATGNVYVSDYYNVRIQKFTGAGTYLSKWDVGFPYPTGLDVAPSGNVYVGIQAYGLVHKYTSTGTLLAQWPTVAAANSQSSQVFGVVVDGGGNVYVADWINNCVEEYDGNGNYITQWGSAGTGNGQFNRPIALAIDSRGLVYVSDGNNNRIQVFTPSGAYVTQWGTAGSGNGQFNGPFSIAFDSGGNIYVCDGYNQRVQKFGPLPIHAITASAGPGGAIAPAGMTLVSDGSDQIYTITPSACTTIADVLVDGVSVGPVSSYTFPANNADHTIEASFTVCVTGNIAGRVTADCPSAGTPLRGVLVDAFQVGTGDLLGTAVTDVAGNYLLQNIPAVDYTVTLVTPLGYTTSAAEVPLTLLGGQTATVNYSVTCIPTAGDPRSSGFWKHEFGIATGGNGSAQFTASALCGLLDVIEAHFNNNALNQVVVYDPPDGATCAQKLEVAKDLLNLGGSAASISRARQQLLALLLNAAANYIGLDDAVSKDGATGSQAITYCDQIIDDPGGDYSKAVLIADKINSGQKVNAGVIPLTTAQIAYRRGLALRSFRVTPNPGPGPRTFQFAMGQAGSARLNLYDVSGRLVKELMNGSVGEGTQRVVWDGTAANGARVGAGLFFARLETEVGSKTLKVIHMYR